MQCAACSHPEAPPVFQWLPVSQTFVHNRCCFDLAVWLKESECMQQLLRAWRVSILRILWLRRRARVARRDLVRRLTWRWKIQALLEEPTLRYAEMAYTRWRIQVLGTVTSDTSECDDMPGLAESESDVERDNRIATSSSDELGFQSWFSKLVCNAYVLSN